MPINVVLFFTALVTVIQSFQAKFPIIIEAFCFAADVQVLKYLS